MGPEDSRVKGLWVVFRSLLRTL
ncbi:protein of unknown function (plasmid) [Magnetospirillum sp. XM-1]|nr:protein of unknown function [Magnetospirillum sp. XM-1]